MQRQDEDVASTLLQLVCPLGTRWLEMYVYSA